MLKTLRLTNDMKVGTLYLTHGVIGYLTHLVPLPSSLIGPKLTSEDESYVDIQSISLCDLCTTRFGGLTWLV